MRATLWIPASLICLALAGGACGGDEGEGPGAAYTQRDRPEQSTSEGPSRSRQDEPGAPADGRDQSADPGQAERDRGEAAHAKPREKNKDGGQARQVRATLGTFLDAMGDEDARRACWTYTRDVRRLVGGTLGGDCARGMEFAFLVIGANDGLFRDVRVKSVDLNRARASVRLDLPRRLRALPMLQLIAPGQRLALERESGRWRLGLPRA
jgi:hypothetical protein